MDKGDDGIQEIAFRELAAESVPLPFTFNQPPFQTHTKLEPETTALQELRPPEDTGMQDTLVNPTLGLL